jgi:hypothetical protein
MAMSKPQATNSPRAPLTAEQQRVLAQVGTGRNVDEICDKASVSKAEFLAWHDDPRFAEAYGLVERERDLNMGLQRADVMRLALRTVLESFIFEPNGAAAMKVLEKLGYFAQREEE